MHLHRTEDFKIILKNFGEVTYYFSTTLFIPILIALIYRESFSNIYPFLYAGLIGMLFGYIIKKIFNTNSEAKIMHAFISIILVWIFLPLVGSLPFTMNPTLQLPLIDAYFESVSALTTTGLTMIQTQTLPNSLIFWRSLEGWIGGAGIVVLALIGVTHYASAGHLFKAEGREERLRPHIINTVKAIWWVYILLTLVGISLLMLAGLPLFESTNLSMSAISTTGVGNYFGDLEIINSAKVELALAITMILGALSFAVHYKFMKGKVKTYVKDTQTRLLFFLIIFGTILLLPKFAALYGTEALRFDYFHVISAITAGGFNATNGADWSEAIKFVLAFLMVIGGAAGSTAGGIKLTRSWIAFKSIWWRIKRATLPENAYFAMKTDGREVTKQEISTVYLFIILYLIFIVIGTAVILFTTNEHSIGDVMFEVISAQGNAGITINVAKPTMNAISKLTLASNMIIGRIEIIPLLFGIGFLTKLRKGGL